MRGGPSPHLKLCPWTAKRLLAARCFRDLRLALDPRLDMMFLWDDSGLPACYIRLSTIDTLLPGTGPLAELEGVGRATAAPTQRTLEAVSSSLDVGADIGTGDGRMRFRSGRVIL